MQLTQLLNKDQKEQEQISVFLTSINQVNTTLNLFYILATYFYKANYTDFGNFLLLT